MGTSKGGTGHLTQAEQDRWARKVSNSSVRSDSKPPQAATCHLLLLWFSFCFHRTKQHIQMPTAAISSLFKDKQCRTERVKDKEISSFPQGPQGKYK